MAKGFSISLTPDSVNKTVRNWRDFDKRVQDDISKLLYQTGVKIQFDSKRESPVKYGVLKSSVYVDWKKVMVKQIQLNPGAPMSPRFPAPASLSNGMDVIIGSIIEYGPKMDERHPTQAGFFSNAVAYHQPRAEQAIDKILERESKR